jgi:hypothetical protein
MENLFIKTIINRDIFDNTPSLIIDGIFDYNPEKLDLVSFKKNQEEFEIIDKDIDEDLKNKREEMIKVLNEEKIRVIKILEYLIVNIDINKIQLPYYKTYDYNNVSNFMKNKIKKHSNNNNFDIVKFNIKNSINKNKDLIISQFSTITNIKQFDNLNEIKLATFFILIKIIEIFDIYLKSIHYSIDIINENPLNTNEDYLINMDNKFFNITDDEINIFHHNLIKNSFNKNNLNITPSTFIKIKRNSNKNFEIIFK